MPNHEFKTYCTGDPLIDNEIKLLCKKYSHTQTEEYFRQLFTTVVRLYLDKAEEVDLHLINVALKELRHALKVFTPYRDKRKVVVFGSHRTPTDSHDYQLAEDFSREMADRGYMVITGGGGGIMEAGNKGAGDKSFAAKIRISAEQTNQYAPKGERLINFNYFFNRKLIFIKESDATVLCPGGFGTHDEGFEVLTLLQTGRCFPRPIVMLESKNGYWEAWLKFVKDKLVRGDFIRPIDLKLFKIVKTAKAAVNEIVNFYSVYHSIRYSKDLTVIRLERQLTKADYQLLNKKFKDLLAKGEIEPSDALPVEKKNDEFPHLPRLKMYFNRQNYVRLLELIRQINSL
ncbi:MAG: TIGR00730 family Rossman fold protein [Candidatus Margulisiibacteriota bacterium]